MSAVAVLERKVVKAEKENKEKLKELAGKIKQHHKNVVASLRTTLDQARETGELLNQAKPLLPRGRWTTWLDKNCGVSDQEAQRYMRIAKHWDRLVSAAADPTSLTLSEALKILAKPSTNGEAARAVASESEAAVARFAVSPEEFSIRREKAAALRTERFTFQPESEEGEAVGSLVEGLLRSLRRTAVRLSGDDADPVAVAILLIEQLKTELQPEKLVPAEQVTVPNSEPQPDGGSTPAPAGRRAEFVAQGAAS